MLCELPLPAALSLTANSDLLADGGDLVIDGALSGTHTLTTNSGTTTVTLTANSSGFSGIIDVATGTLHNAGTLAYATANVEQQGTLTGTVGMVAGPLLTTTGRATSGTGALINWTNDGSESEFVIESKIGTGTYSIVGYAGATDSAMLVTGLIVSTGYTFRVTGYDAHGITGENNITSTITTDATDDSGVYEVSLPDTSGTTGLALIHGPHSRTSGFYVEGGTMDVVAGSAEEAVIEAISGQTHMNADSTYLSAYALNFHFDMSFSGSGYTGPAITFEDAYPGGGTNNSFMEVSVDYVDEISAYVSADTPEADQDTVSSGVFAVNILGCNASAGTFTFHMTDSGNAAGHYTLSTNGGSGTTWYNLIADEFGKFSVEFASGITKILIALTPDGSSNTGDAILDLDSITNGDGAQTLGAYFCGEPATGPASQPPATQKVAINETAKIKVVGDDNFAKVLDKGCQWKFHTEISGLDPDKRYIQIVTKTIIYTINGQQHLIETRQIDFIKPRPNGTAIDHQLNTVPGSTVGATITFAIFEVPPDTVADEFKGFKSYTLDEKLYLATARTTGVALDGTEPTVTLGQEVGQGLCRVTYDGTGIAVDFKGITGARIDSTADGHSTAGIPNGADPLDVSKTVDKDIHNDKIKPPPSP